MRLFKRNAKAPTVDLAYCEPSSATIFSKVHIRTVGDEGRKYGGGAPSTTLCGYDIRWGWDIGPDVDVDGVERRLGAGPDALNPLCRTCGEVFTLIRLAGKG